MNPERPIARDPPSDAELLSRVSARATQPSESRAAQAVFYARHIRYLYGVLLRHKKNLLPLAGLSAEDLAQETFHRAFERASTFEADDSLDHDRQEMRARAWLGRIATNLLADRLRGNREVSASPYLERVVCEGIDEDAPPSRSPKAILVSEGMERLSERERDVLRVSALHYRAGEEHQRLPNDVSQELARRWSTTNENIRAIRVRAMKKLKAFVLSQGASSEEVP